MTCPCGGGWVSVAKPGTKKVFVQCERCRRFAPEGWDTPAPEPLEAPKPLDIWQEIAADIRAGTWPFHSPLFGDPEKVAARIEQHRKEMQ